MTGFATPELAATPNPADFGSVAVTNFADQTITITNHGSKSVTFNFVGVDDDWHFQSFAGCFGTTLAPGATCTQTPRFQPNNEGPHAGTFRLGWYDSTQTSRTGTITVPMRGYANGELSISPGYADFGSVAVTSSSDRTLTVTNHGTRTVTFNFVGVDDDWHFQTFAGCFGTALAPGASCTQTPRFRPDNEGPHTGTFRLGWYDTADSGRTGTLTATLLGTATPELTATPNPFAFGSVAVGEVGEQVITVTNNGSKTLTFNFVGVDGDWHFQ